MTTREDFEKAPTADPDRAVWWAITSFTVCTVIGLAAAALIGAASDGSANYLLIQPAAEEDSSFNWFFALLGVFTGIITASILFVGMTIAEQLRIHRKPVD
jgi:uncharacterized membrane protein